MIGTRRLTPLASAPSRDRTRWETILGACSEAVAVVDGEGTVMLSSALMERELGRDTLVGASLVNLIHPGDYPDFIGTLVSFVADVGVVTWSDWRFRHANGSWVEMETTATNLLDDPGVHGIVLTSRNVTARNATNRALEEARRRLEAVLDIAGAAIFVTELDGTIALANRACATLFGLQPEQMLGRRAADLLGPDEARQMEVHGREALRAGHALQFDEFIEIDGDSRHFLSTKVPIFDADERPTGLCSVATDITDRARAQTEKEALTAALDRSQRMDSLGQLAGGVAHDFNNLLAVILNYADFVAESIGDDHAAADDVAEISRATERAAALTRQLLVFSRHDHLKLEAVDVNKVALDTQRLLDRTLGEDVTLEVLRSDLPVHALADAGQLEQVFMNLVLNARDAMPRGGRVTVAIARFGGHIRVTVADDGDGMSPETAERAFEPFFTTKEKGRGTGLGLATVYGIVTGAGGQIEIESRLEEGTTITMHLPIADPGDPAAESAPTQLDAPNGLSVMVVEDEDAIRTLTRRILTRQGYEVIDADGPQDAIAQCAEQSCRPDLLLTDVVMPGMSGVELSERLRELQPGLRVLFMSGYTHNVMDRYGLDGSGDTLVQKPFNGHQLLTAVQEALAAEPPAG